VGWFDWIFHSESTGERLMPYLGHSPTQWEK
jgi:hypothetical protein